MGECRLGVVGSFTVEPLGRYTDWSGAAGAVSHMFYRFAGFGQIVPACRDPAGQFRHAELDGILILWRLEDLFEPLLAASSRDTAGLDALVAEVDRLCGEVEGLRGRFGGTVVFALPPLPRCAGFDPMRAEDGAPLRRAHQEAVRTISRRLGARADIRLLDLEAVVRHHGARHAYDDRKWYLYRQPFSEAVYRTIADQARRLISSERTPPKKCVVVDCDNTLWGGIVGEDGIGGLQLGDTFPGRAFVDFQKELLALRRRGIFLAVSSKNDETDVAEVFDSHDAMVLRRSDLSAFRVNWERKSANIAAIARQLNIGLDSVVFVDDSPVEIAEVGHALPEVTCVLVPEELASLPSVLRESALFDTVSHTPEDRIRVDAVDHERRRERLRSRLDAGDYLASLRLVATVREARDIHLERVAQLINKTNQFNLTTRRRTLADVRTIAARRDSGIYVLDLKDRFGAYGLTGVAIVHFKGRTAELDTFLLSCRVLNRGVEDAFLSALAGFARDRGCRLLQGTFRPTGKNHLVEDFFPARGFVPSGAPGSGHWERSIEQGYPAPAHIERVDPRPANVALEPRRPAVRPLGSMGLMPADG